MLGKTLMLGVISASAALGIVYFGTAPQGSQAAEAHPHDDVKVENATKSPKETARERIEPRLPTVRKAEPDNREKLASNDGVSAASAEDAEVTVESAATMPPAKDDGSQPKTQSRWLDQYLKKNRGDDSKGKNDVSDSETEDNPSGATSSATNSYTVTERGVIDDIEPEVMVEDTPITEAGQAETDSRVFRIENGKLVEITQEGAVEFSDTAAQDMNNAMDRSAIREEMPKNKAKGFVYKNQEAPSDATPLLSTVMAEAEQIKKPELRDQAYFEITEYALSEGRYESARAAHDMIAQEELSYTAKSRIAVAFAQNGMPTKAFKVIEEVDEPELRDFMRLQVIEALIAPQNLPETWQEKNN